MMTKLALGIFWAVAVLGLLGVAVVWSTPENHAQEQQASHPQKSQDADPENNIAQSRSGSTGWRKYKEKIEQNEKFITATSTLFIAGFTIALAFATLFLWLATKDLESVRDHAVF